ncbi:MAG TPA: HAD family hydrolase [Solirubrobacterales bacterium]|jgi:putative hydrolase of the HAD superfamily|nr:HAD family hydrolase [Solirubrobacterales bacterium]
MGSALLFYLDETLMIEEPAAVAAFAATAEFAATRHEIAPELLASGARFRARELWYAVFADVAEALAGLAESHPLAVVTNGAGCLQREKLAASGLGDLFQSVVVSADLGVAKPDASVFRHALGQLGVDSADAVMVGDSIAKDVDGALAAGLAAVWVNRNRSSAPADRTDVIEISTLSDLKEALGE